MADYCNIVKKDEYKAEWQYDKKAIDTNLTVKIVGRMLRRLQIGKIIKFRIQLRPSTTDSAAAPEGSPTAEDERQRHRPVATYLPPSPLLPTRSNAQFPLLYVTLRGEMDDRDDLLLRKL